MPVGYTGAQGPPGIPGKPGPVGPPGLVNDVKIRRVFLENLEAVFRFMNWSAFLDVTLESCQDVSDRLSAVPNIRSGVFNINQPRLGWIDVECDLTMQQEGWTVFQRRMDGSVDFFRVWEEYVNGFGKQRGEFWLGLEKLHQMTMDGHYELRIDMTERSGTRLYAKYSDFKVGPASDNYRLTAEGYSGNATDAFGNLISPRHSQNGQQFSTKDADHDRSSLNCARDWSGGWWYNRCMNSNLNGLYDYVDGAQAVSWRDQIADEYMYMAFTEMKFRKTY